MNLKAFTLIETLVAVTLLTFAVVGPLTAANRGLVVATTARDQLTASYLAQEGIETARLIRDDDYLSNYPATTGNAWNTFLGHVSGCGRGNNLAYCQIDPIAAPTTVYACSCNAGGTCDPGSSGTHTPPTPSNSSCTALNLKTATNLYQRTGGAGTTGTLFTRAIQAVDIGSNGNDERITSSVTWLEHGVLLSVSITDHLTPWQ